MNNDLFSNVVNKIDFKEKAKSPSGDIEINKYLYEIGLQNVFNDYQKNIANLSQERQKQIEDAYQIREMSKKYLGEYASNVGVGDVSGNLLDIYSNYQNNINLINQNMQGLELNLEREYQQAKLEGIANIMQSQYGIEVSKLNDLTKTVMQNIASGNFEEKNAFEYLESVRPDIGEDNYRTLYEIIYQQQFEEINERLGSGFYGYKDTVRGRERITDPQEFLKQYEGVLNKKDFDYLNDLLTFQKDIDEALGTNTIMNKYTDSARTQENEYYIGDDYDFNLMLGGENVDHTSYGFVDSNGVKKFTVKDDATKDDKYEATSEDIFAEYQMRYENGDVPSPNPSNYDIITVNTRVKTKDGNGNMEAVDYMFRNGTWYRLVTEKPISELDMKFWREDNDQKSNGRYDVRIAGKDRIIINGVKYVRDINAPVEEKDRERIEKLFKRVHGDGKGGIIKQSFVYDDETKTIYFYDKKGKILKTVKK